MPAPKPIEVEMLPPRPRGGRDTPDLSRLIAWLLDDLIPIPGTKFRVGLDPIIGLIPGLGDGSSAAISTMILFNAMRAGVPRIVLVRMALNVLVNALVGVVPGVGDLFSAFFKSNRRNYELLQRHAGNGAVRNSTTADWIFVAGLIAGVLAFVIAASTVALWIGYQGFKLVLPAGRS